MANVIFEIVLIIILIVLTGILSMAELAVVSTKKAKLEKLLNEGHKSAQIIIDFAEDPNQFLSTVQIGITLIGILTGAYGGATLAEPLSEVIGPYVPYSGTISILVVVIITTYLTLVIGEIVPKVIALNNPEKVSLKLAKSMSVLSKVCKPISAVLAKSTDFVLWTIGMKSKSESIVTEEEIELLIEEGREDGTIEKEEEDIIKRVFKLDDKKVESIMTPRNEIIWVDLEDDKRANEIKIMESKRSIFPIAKGELDDFIGVVQAKDILALLFSEEKFDINSIIKKPLVVSENLETLELLKEFYRIRKDKVDDFDTSKYDDDMSIAMERETLGINLSHKTWWESIPKNKKIKIDTAFVTNIREYTDKRGRLMAFLELSIEGCPVNAIVFASTYSRYQATFKNIYGRLSLVGKKDDKDELIIDKASLAQSA